MSYSQEDDLLLGDVPISSRLNRRKFVTDAADEIDSVIGQVYATPVPMADPTKRHTQLLLKRLNNFLATGRLILAITTGTEDNQLHAYGFYLVKEVYEALEKIRNGEIILDGVEPAEETTSDIPGPAIVNADSASAVDAFYNRVMRPELNWPGPYPYRDWAPGDDPTGAGIAGVS